MDQIKIGAFIAALRKERNLTQKQLAEKLNISDKTVSKWECGKGLPEVSLMLPLCEELGITVNELLSGERLEKENYEGKAEENMLNLMIENKKKELSILKSRCFAYGILAFLGMFLNYTDPEIFHHHIIMKGICHLGMAGCVAFGIFAVVAYCKKKISGLSCFFQIVFWSFTLFVFFVLNLFI